MADAIEIGGRLTLMQVAKAVNKLNGDFRSHVSSFDELTTLVAEQTAATKALNAKIEPIAGTVAGYEEVRKSSIRFVRWALATVVVAFVTVVVQAWWQHHDTQSQLAQVSQNTAVAAASAQHAAASAQKTANAIGVP
jgi:hypothetical protein